ncbi:unnamed protein product [Bursaphelenchus okinawaensis]|uniref:Uncharacterized protein n=1 Tax=Bursaphelenchus okinawaensis TaxID=465554 RepID=A0A811KX88_9BILA|nr:unnamed protein product [Bursaphelenchus okinawaensis]CAG9113710.1 unnamed protein product [Bursaphelenchus okinawaensis]
MLDSEDQDVINEIEKRELDELPFDYLRSLQSNLSLYYLPIFIILIPILWYLTTFPYRAALQPLDPTLDRILVPYNISIRSKRQWRSPIEEAIQNLQKQHENVKFFIKYVVLEEEAGKEFVLDRNGLNLVVFEGKTNLIRFVKEDYVVVELKDHYQLENLLKKVLGLERLDIIQKTDENTLDVQSMSVWDRMPISNFYHLQLVYLHENGVRSAEKEEKIQRETEKFVQLASKYGFYADIGIEHLWDFDVDDYIEVDQKSGEKRFKNDKLETLTTEVNKGTAWTRSLGIDKPLIKIAIFSLNDNINFYNNGKLLNGQIIASWGGITSTSVNSTTQSQQKRLFSAVVDIVKAQLGVSELPHILTLLDDNNKATDVVVDSNDKGLPMEYEWRRFEKAAFLEHCQRARAALKTIHLLKKKLEFMVITREVAVHFYEAHEILVQTLLEARVYGKLDIKKAIRARLLAERAAAHKDLIDNLDFPFENRYAMYISLFLPVYHMMYGGGMAALAFIVFYFKVKRGKEVKGKMLPYY